MEKRISDKACIEHILEAISQIQQFTEGISYDAYKQDLKLRLTLTRLVEIMGEAANYVSDETQNTFPDVEWAWLNRVRNILIHDYSGIDYEKIWRIKEVHLPPLKTDLELILAAFQAPAYAYQTTDWRSGRPDFFRH